MVENYHVYDTNSVKTADKDDEEFRVYDEETSPRVREVSPSEPPVVVVVVVVVVVRTCASRPLVIKQYVHQ